MKYVFSDEILAAVAQSLQLGILTGTDVVDHLRLLEVEPDPTDVMPTVGQQTQTLVLTAECKERHERNIADLLARALELSKQAQAEQASEPGKAGQA
jgi:tRNA pseudouridine-54 N-methylase